MQGDITRRFLYAYQLLRKEGIVKSARQFAISLEYLPQSWSEIINGRRDIPLDLLYRASIQYKIDPSFLFSGDGEPFFVENMQEKIRIRTIVVTDEAQERIVFVPQSAMEFYPSKLNQPEYIQLLPTLTLPGFYEHQGHHRMFQVIGDQMEPSLFDGDKVFGSYLHPDEWATSLRDNHVYILVTNTDITVKRILNQAVNQNSLIFMSDNSFYPPTRVYLEDLKEIWLVTQKLSPFLHSQTYREDMLKEQIDMLYDQMSEQKHLLNTLIHKG